MNNTKLVDKYLTISSLNLIDKPKLKGKLVQCKMFNYDEAQVFGTDYAEQVYYNKKYVGGCLQVVDCVEDIDSVSFGYIEANY